jgi:hypothetical protein
MVAEGIMASKCRLTELLRELPSLLATYDDYIFKSDETNTWKKKDKLQLRRVEKMVFDLTWDIGQLLEEEDLRQPAELRGKTLAEAAKAGK